MSVTNDRWKFPAVDVVKYLDDAHSVWTNDEEQTIYLYCCTNGREREVTYVVIRGAVNS